jgi:hypothetical protein
MSVKMCSPSISPNWKFILAIKTQVQMAEEWYDVSTLINCTTPCCRELAFRQYHVYTFIYISTLTRRPTNQSRRLRQCVCLFLISYSEQWASTSLNPSSSTLDFETVVSTCWRLTSHNSIDQQIEIVENRILLSICIKRCGVKVAIKVKDVSVGEKEISGWLAEQHTCLPFYPSQTGILSKQTIQFLI